jgi:class 3 adenylate cyclase
MTFLMTDVEGSTRLWEQQREAMAAALAKHDSVLRGNNRGAPRPAREVDRDGALANFTRAVEAVAAAVAIERRITAEKWATSEPLPRARGRPQWRGGGTGRRLLRSGREQDGAPVVDWAWRSDPGISRNRRTHARLTCRPTCAWSIREGTGCAGLTGPNVYFN